MADQKGLDIELEKVEELAEIVAAGVMSTPAVMVNGEVVHAGGVPSKYKIQTWLL
jgi:predicted thioredoxin/glutaredoxin